MSYYKSETPGAPNYNDAPPSYEESLKHQKIDDSSFPQNSYPKQSTASITPGLAYPQQQPRIIVQTQPMMYYQPNLYQPIFHPGQNVIALNSYDSSARFSTVAPPSIPPPPPGVAPSVVQLAAQSGANVVVSKKKSNFW